VGQWPAAVARDASPPASRSASAVAGDEGAGDVGVESQDAGAGVGRGWLLCVIGLRGRVGGQSLL
jgi:hypothetical protein